MCLDTSFVTGWFLVLVTRESGACPHGGATEEVRLAGISKGEYVDGSSVSIFSR